MTFDMVMKGETALIALGGEIDLQHSPTVRKGLLDCLLEKRGIVVDMAEVAYIDSSGIASLVEAYQAARKNSTYFALAAVSPPALRVLQLARLDKVFTIKASVDEALGEAG